MGGDKKPLKNSLNFLKYIGYEAYCLINCCFSCCRVEEFEQFKEGSDQMQRELDISYLLKRLSALEALLYSSDKAVDITEYKKRSFEEADYQAERINH